MDIDVNCELLVASWPHRSLSPPVKSGLVIPFSFIKLHRVLDLRPPPQPVSVPDLGDVAKDFVPAIVRPDEAEAAVVPPGHGAPHAITITITATATGSSAAASVP